MSAATASHQKASFYSKWRTSEKFTTGYYTDQWIKSSPDSMDTFIFAVSVSIAQKMSHGRTKKIVRGIIPGILAK